MIQPNTPLSNVHEEALRIIRQAEREQFQLRLIGGLAIKVNSPNIVENNLHREYPDIDFVTERKGQSRLMPFFAQLGYGGDKEFNTLNGGRRQLYYDRHHNRQIDVFIGDFQMCHRLPLSGRLGLHRTTVPLAELFLSKAQIVQLNLKDAKDLFGLLLDNELGTDDRDTINLERLVELCTRDWGLYKTTEMNLSRLEAILHSRDIQLSGPQTERIEKSIQRIRSAMESAPKPLLWKARDRVGERVRWYAEVEEVHRS